MKTPVYLIAFLLVPALSAQTAVLDGFDSPADWKLIVAEGVTADIRAVADADRSAIRLDYDFHQGGGYCVLRRELSLELPDNYAFAFDVRGEGPPNNLEFKLIDPGGQNVWWLVRRGYYFPRDWRRLKQKARHIQFA